MKVPMLVIDKNIEFSNKEQVEWKKYGIDTVRVDTMQQGIEQLSKIPYLFTAVNADNINYLPLLQTMHDTAQSFIFVIGTNFNVDEQEEALHNGALLYGTFRDGIEENVRSVLAQLMRFEEIRNQPRKPPEMFIYDKFLVLPNSNQIFCNDMEIELTTKEYSLLYYFIVNHDRIITYPQLYDKLWGKGYDEATNENLWDTVYKVRKKLKEITSNKNYIENVKDTGYRFSTYNDK